MKNSIRAIRSMIWLALAAVGILGAAMQAARADDQAGVPAGESSAARGGLQEVVVTATRHEESLSKVPISVTALTQETMDQKGIKDFLDIARFTPGVTIDNSATNAISIRGISSSGGAGTTGIYIDDTPVQMRSVGFNPDDTLPKTFDLERVEILRGPQGTLFGAGSEGGAVRYILTQPSVTSTSTYVRSEASYTQYGQPNFELGLAHGRPLIDGTLGVRGSLWYRSDGGWINRVDPTTAAVTEHNVDRGGTLVARLAAIWQPAGSFRVTPSILYQHAKRHDDSTYWPAYSNPSAGDFNTATPERIPQDDEYYLPALKLQWDLGKSQIISNSSYYHRKQLTAYQGTVYDLAYYQAQGWPTAFFGGLGCGAASATPVPPCSWYPLLDGNGIHLPAGFSNYQTPNTIRNAQQSYTQEVRWQSTDESAKLRWTLGAFWQLAKEGSIEELKDTRIIPFFNYLYGIDPTSTSYYGPYYSCPTNVNYPAIPACDIYYNANTAFDRQIAGYGELSYGFTDWFRVTLGERVARTSFSLTHYADGLENFGPGPAHANQHETPNTPKVTFSFQVDPQDLFYATYAKGFRVGGGNAPLPQFCNADLAAAGYPNGAPLTYKSDSTQSYELGSKNTFGQVVRIATSVYYIKWNGIQQSIYVAGACGLQFTDNLGTAVAWGGDLQAELALGALHIDLATGYTSARYTKNAPPDCSANGIPCKASNGDAISGQAAIDYAPGLNPPFTVALGAEYGFKLGQRGAFVRADWEYQSRNPWPSTLQNPNDVAQYNPNTYTLPATSFTSIRAGVYLGDWQVAAFVDNLFDSHTVTSYALGQSDPHNPAGSPTVQQNQYTYRPRTLGITATWRLGSAH